jgi:hypothetical protein
MDSPIFTNNIQLSAYCDDDIISWWYMIPVMLYQITWQSNNVVLNKIAKTGISNVCVINCCRQFCHHLSTICEHNIFGNENPDSKLSIFPFFHSVRTSHETHSGLLHWTWSYARIKQFKFIGSIWSNFLQQSFIFSEFSVLWI